MHQVPISIYVCEKWNVYDDRVWDDYGGGGMGKHGTVMEYMNG